MQPFSAISNTSWPVKLGCDLVYYIHIPRQSYSSLLSDCDTSQISYLTPDLDLCVEAECCMLDLVKKQERKDFFIFCKKNSHALQPILLSYYYSINQSILYRLLLSIDQSIHSIDWWIYFTSSHFIISSSLEPQVAMSDSYGSSEEGVPTATGATNNNQLDSSAWYDDAFQLEEHIGETPEEWQERKEKLAHAREEQLWQVALARQDQKEKFAMNQALESLVVEVLGTFQKVPETEFLWIWPLLGTGTFFDSPSHE